MKKTESEYLNHCPFDDCFLEHAELLSLTNEFGTPLFVYDEKGLRERAKSLLAVFSSCGAMHYFPVEKCPVPQLLRVLCEEGLGAHCQSPEELQLALDCGFPGDRILYGATVIDPITAKRVRDLDCILLIGSPLVL